MSRSYRRSAAVLHKLIQLAFLSEGSQGPPLLQKVRQLAGECSEESGDSHSSEARHFKHVSR